ncbi:hypothetical protein L3X38_026322 [Prunus dulcis]|uniref:Uncharacterized protein n=1 Tax=Prunus dulcis TaxID=3755 RepID=A0AAD4VN34_PRUDU|nr:hypothetical protein L3X38_026322 [Prunus dulcis]
MIPSQPPQVVHSSPGRSPRRLEMVMGREERRSNCQTSSPSPNYRNLHRQTQDMGVMINFWGRKGEKEKEIKKGVGAVDWAMVVGGWLATAVGGGLCNGGGCSGWLGGAGWVERIEGR